MNANGWGVNANVQHPRSYYASERDAAAHTVEVCTASVYAHNIVEHNVEGSQHQTAIVPQVHLKGVG